MGSAAEVRRNLHELQSLRSISSRPFVQDLLDREIANCQKQLDELKASSLVEPLHTDTKTVPSAVNSKTTSVKLLPTVKLTSYGWDQSDKYVKLYLNVANIQAVPAERINVCFGENNFELNAEDVGGKNYTLTMKDLLHPIDSTSSYFKQKKDTILLMLRKKKDAEKWDYLTKREAAEKKKSFDTPKFDGEEPQEYLMNMLKKMYDEGDDEMKRNIAKAYQEGQNKHIAGLSDM